MDIEFGEILDGFVVAPSVVDVVLDADIVHEMKEFTFRLLSNRLLCFDFLGSGHFNFLKIALFHVKHVKVGESIVVFLVVY